MGTKCYSFVFHFHGQKNIKSVIERFHTMPNILQQQPSCSSVEWINRTGWMISNLYREGILSLNMIHNNRHRVVAVAEFMKGIHVKFMIYDCHLSHKCSTIILTYKISDLMWLWKETSQFYVSSSHLSIGFHPSYSDLNQLFVTLTYVYGNLFIFWITCCLCREFLGSFVTVPFLVSLCYITLYSNSHFNEWFCMVQEMYPI